jgi:alkenylglycerophosphocholine/alkenylglycerophosphoethanolamine hydrolase
LTPFLVTLGLCAAAVFLTGLAVDNYPIRLISKPLVSGAILAWTLISRRDRFARLISLALGFCLLGDILLEFRASLFLPGLVAFLMGHIFFIAAFLSDNRQPAIVRLIPIALWIATDFWIIYPGLGAMMIPVGAYVIVIGVMVWRAAARVGSQGNAYWSEWSGLIGAFLFAFSDSLIALDRFYIPMAGARYVIILTYWAALVLLASTILRKPDRSGAIR